MIRHSIFTNVGADAALQASTGGIVVERRQARQPHRGKIFAAVHAHSYEVPHFAAGLCSKLMSEGYTGYIVRTTNDQMGGGLTSAENLLNNEQEHLKMAAVLGFKDVFDLYYRDRRMNGVSLTDLRSRLILIFRMLKVDTVISFNPWGPWEEDPDRLATGRAVEEASWMAGAVADDNPEYQEAGIKPHPVGERYYFYARPSQQFNRVVDISSHVEKKIDAIVECRNQGGGNLGSQLRAELAKKGRRLPLLGSDDRTADREYIRQFVLDGNRQYGKGYNFAYAERFYHIDRRVPAKSNIDEYVERNAVRVGT
jgi:LmbE family N-acetylglucosaminyl deacetylase